LPLESLKSLQLLRPTVYTIYLAVGSSCEFAPAPITRLPSASDSSSSFRFLKWEGERRTTWPSVCVWGLHTVLLPLSRFRMCRQQQQGPEYLVKLWRLWNGSVIDGGQNCSFSTISESCLIALPLFRESRWAETEREGGLPWFVASELLTGNAQLNKWWSTDILPWLLSNICVCGPYII
jgi:hypothetical protein